MPTKLARFHANADLVQAKWKQANVWPQAHK